MVLVLNQLADNPGARYKSKRVGRGIGSGKGKTCGSGGKGQTARSGTSTKGFEGGQTPIYRRLPKRGFNSINPTKFHVVNLYDIAHLVETKLVAAGALINAEVLVKSGLIKKQSMPIKLLGSGEVVYKLKFQLDAYSESAKTKIAAAGGEIIE